MNRLHAGFSSNPTRLVKVTTNHTLLAACRLFLQGVPKNASLADVGFFIPKNVTIGSGVDQNKKLLYFLLTRILGLRALTSSLCYAQLTNL